LTLKALMVDVDGVLLTQPPGASWADRLHADLGLDPRVLGEAFFKPHWDDVAMGRADLHARLAPVLAQVAPHLTSQALAAYWFAHDANRDEALLADLAQARAGGLALHLATVQEHHRARYLWETLGFGERFDAMHHSAGLGVGKPDPAFFSAVGRRTGLAAHEMRLIDDRLENVEAARAAGWSGFHWTRGARLAQALA